MQHPVQHLQYCNGKGEGGVSQGVDDTGLEVLRGGRKQPVRGGGATRAGVEATGPGSAHYPPRPRAWGERW